MQLGLESIVSFVGFYVSGLLQNRGVVSVSYVLCVVAARRNAENPH